MTAIKSSHTFLRFQPSVCAAWREYFIVLTVIEVFDVMKRKTRRRPATKALVFDHAGEYLTEFHAAELVQSWNEDDEQMKLIGRLPNRMPSQRRGKEEYDKLVREFYEIVDCDKQFPPREPNWGRAWHIWQELDGIVRRMVITKAERKRLHDEIDQLNGYFARAIERAIEEYPLQMESLLEQLRVTIDRVKNRELPAKDAWSAIGETGAFFQKKRIRSAIRDQGILRFKAMVQELKKFQREK